MKSSLFLCSYNCTPCNSWFIYLYFFFGGIVLNVAGDGKSSKNFGLLVSSPLFVFLILRLFFRFFLFPEADEMLGRGYKDQIYEIFKYLPGKIQVCIFSRTMPSEVLETAAIFTHKPLKFVFKRDDNIGRYEAIFYCS